MTQSEQGKIPNPAGAEPAPEGDAPHIGRLGSATVGIGPHPTIGRIVHIKNRQYGNDAIEAAIITNVWSATLVNVRVFPDTGGNQIWITSVPLEGSSPGYEGPVWGWPPRF